MKKQFSLFISILAISILSFAVYSQPVAVDGIDALTPDRNGAESATGVGVASQSGNTTQLMLNATKTTQHWQGYYGNITGEITLDDADSNTLFAWTLANPTGEIFAVNTSESVQWTNITCVNLTNATQNGLDGHGASKINGTTLDDQYGIKFSEMDNFSGTFNSQFTGSINIGDVVIDSDDACPLTYLFVNNQSQTTDFEELLLFDNASALLFTAILETDQVGFDGSLWDFQMLTAQNDSVIGTYYFYVELS